MHFLSKGTAPGRTTGFKKTKKQLNLSLAMQIYIQICAVTVAPGAWNTWPTGLLSADHFLKINTLPWKIFLLLALDRCFFIQNGFRFPAETRGPRI
jgi:hypothetical protein